MLKRKLLFLLIMMILTVVIMAGSITAFLTSQKNNEKEVIVGDVDVDITVYFEKENDFGEPIKYTQNLDFIADAGNGNTFTKFGVTKIDISNVNEIKFIKNFRVEINVKSNVDTYFRIAPYEQLTLAYTVGDTVREVAVTQKKFMEFNYDPSNNFLNNRMYDGFYYYKNKVKRISESQPFVINFIGEWLESVNFRLYDPKYTLQIGFYIEAVQAHLGPQILWGLDDAPWGGEW